MLRPACLLNAALCVTTGHLCADDLPNIVIIVADDLGWADVEYHGSPIATPNIDRLAAEGVRLENFHVAPLCSPTRAGLMTGRWPIRYGMGESVITPWRKWGLSLQEETLADMLSRAGYEQRAAVGKWHLGHFRKAYLPQSRGFTSFYGHYNGAFDYFTHKREGELDWHRNEKTSDDKGYSTDLIGDEAVRVIQRSKNKPFFLYVPFNAPHDPMQAKAQDLEKYADNGRDRQAYCAMVDCMDQAIGRILKALKDAKVEDDTFVLFFSDNGGITQWADNSPLRAGKGTVYEGGIRTPAIVRWPNVLQGGRVFQELTGYIDVFPTLMQVAGYSGKTANPLDGIGILDALRDGTKLPVRSWFSYIAQGKPDRMSVIRGGWKLVANNGSVLDFGAKSQRPELELFQIARDPAELNNVADENPVVIRDLYLQLREHRELKIDGIPDFLDGRDGFKAPKDWKITQE